MARLRMLMICCLIAASIPAWAEPPDVPLVAEPWPAWTEKFQSTDGWIGGDGAYSVRLDAERTLWLFSDTLVGTIRDGRRQLKTMVNNTIGIQTGHGPDAQLAFEINRDAEGQPIAFFRPDDGVGWFWLMAGTVINGKLYVFLPRIERDGEGAFGFRQTGMSLGIVDNPADTPQSWRIQQQALRCVEFGPQRNLSYGGAVLQNGGWLYIYGTDETRQPNEKLPNKRLVLARVPCDKIPDQAAWQFFSEQGWQAEYRLAKPIADGLANEFSVTPQLAGNGWQLVYTDHGLGPKILHRTAEHPEGPWSAPSVLFTCPEMAASSQVFTYAAKAHVLPPTGSGHIAPAEFLVTYVANTYELRMLIDETRWYWPQAIRVHR